ncbi:hypothetical protein PP768_gp47 [Escherichia phage vB_EcoP-ZQ2]|uniref:Uncharacterized protein n=1 Tax=Escherichia phage vB_EcoP-ZQ2 TaxID=2810370 RepID=A0A8F3C7L0_9CAUD|nr:hypothetical protein PP768_gp47 [Escherichia phage vB_EcoP-ZQ2]QWY13182.1 hypothetical protein [Escherichia phage vB_EcoP-ZQ2]
MQITLNQAEVEAAIQAYVDEQVNYPGEASIVVNADGTASIGINEEVSHNDDTPPVGVEKKTRRSRKNPQEAKHRPVEPEPEEAVEDVKVEETQTSTGGPNESSTPEPEEEAVTEPEAQEEAVQEEVKAEEPAEKPATKPSLFAGLKRS